MIGLKSFPPDTRLNLRAVPLHTGAEPKLFDPDGNRVTVFLTNTARFNFVFFGFSALWPMPVRKPGQDSEKDRAWPVF